MVERSGQLGGIGDTLLSPTDGAGHEERSYELTGPRCCSGLSYQSSFAVWRRRSAAAADAADGPSSAPTAQSASGAPSRPPKQRAAWATQAQRPARQGARAKPGVADRSIGWSTIPRRKLGDVETPLNDAESLTRRRRAPRKSRRGGVEEVPRRQIRSSRASSRRVDDVVEPPRRRGRVRGG